MLVLSLFPGIGLLDMAFEEEGFCVVRGPDLLWGGDVKRFHVPRGRFDGIIGGPPCQIWSRMRFLNPNAGKKHGDLIPQFARCVREGQPDWFLMENVPDAPPPDVGELYSVKRVRFPDVAVGGVTSRDRVFTFGAMGGQGAFYVDELALHPRASRQSVLAGGCGRPVPVKIGGSGKVKKTYHPRHGPNPGARMPLADTLEGQGLPPDFLSDPDLPFTVNGKRHMVGNGVPLPMGRAVARAVKRALGIESRVCGPHPQGGAPEMTLKEFFRKARRAAKWEVRNTIAYNQAVRAVGRNECPLQVVSGKWLPSIAAESLNMPYAKACKIANAADRADHKYRPWLLKNLGVGSRGQEEPQ